MKTQDQAKQFLALWAIVIVGTCLLIIIFSPMANAQYQYPKKVIKEQKERSFEEWEKNQPSIRIKAVKSAVKQSREMKGKRSQNARLIRKENRIRKQIIK